MLQLIVVVICVISSIGAAPREPLSSIFERCDTKTQFFDCLAKNIGTGVRYFGTGTSPYKVPVIDPLILKKVFVNGGRRTIKGPHTYKNVRLTGLTNFTNIKSTANILNLLFKTETIHPRIVFDSDFLMKGKILNQPVDSDGKLNIILENVKVEHAVQALPLWKNNDMHFNLTDFTVKLVPERAHFKFSSLKNGNEVMDDTINKMVNDDWKNVYDDISETHDYAYSIAMKQWGDKLTEHITFFTVFS